jgi:hypothetical protein
MTQQAEDIGVLDTRCDDFLQSFSSLPRTIHQPVKMREGNQGTNVLRINTDRALISLDRFMRTIQPREHLAAMIMKLRMLRLMLQGALQRGQQNRKHTRIDLILRDGEECPDEVRLVLNDGKKLFDASLIDFGAFLRHRGADSDGVAQLLGGLGSLRQHQPDGRVIGAPRLRALQMLDGFIGRIAKTATHRQAHQGLRVVAIQIPGLGETQLRLLVLSPVGK